MLNFAEQLEMPNLQPDPHHSLSVTRKHLFIDQDHIGPLRQYAHDFWIMNLFILFRIMRQSRPQPGAV